MIKHKINECIKITDIFPAKKLFASDFLEISGNSCVKQKLTRK